nr:TadE/TadG family type IV pilus assembly protein [uncultured Rhodopila sp.]
MPGSLRKIFQRLCRDRRGVSAIEFAFIASGMALLAFGAYDFGNAEQKQIQLQEAVRAGGAYAISRPTDTTGIQAAVTNALPNGWALIKGNVLTVNCSWIDPGATTPTLNALPSCKPTDLAGAPAKSGKTISIMATSTYTPIYPWPFPFPTSSTATYVVRFQ